MFLNIIKRKLKVAFTGFLSVVFLLQSTVSVSAEGSTNGAGIYTNGGGALSDVNIAVGWDSGMAIFLTGDDDYMIDSYEAQGQYTGGETAPTKQAVDGFETQAEEKFTVNEALAQVFRRTYISWEEEDVKNSFVLMAGRNSQFSQSYKKIKTNFYSHGYRTTDQFA